MAYKIHSDLGEAFLYAIDAKTKMRLSTEYQLRPKDIVSIISAKKKV
ncbi:MAG: TGS domain-containing protein [Nitrososphaerota archaeon]